MKKLSLPILAAAAVLAVWPALAADPIRIGAVVCASGPASSIGDPEAKVLTHYVKKVNNAGGLLGRQVELVLYDDEGKADKTAVLVKRLIESDKVDLIIGPSLTGNTMAVAAMVERAEIPMLSMGGGVVIVDPVKKWIFKIPHTDKQANERVLMDMKKNGISRIGLIYGNDGYGKSGSAVTKELIGNYGISIVAEETYFPNDVDVTAQLTRIKNAPGIQAMFNIGFGQVASTVARNAKQLNLGLPFYESHGVSTKTFITLAGVEAVEGIRLVATSLIAPGELPDGDKQKAVSLEFKTEYEKTFGGEANYYGGIAYDAFLLATSALKRAGSTDKSKVRDALEQTSVIGTSGHYRMSATDHSGLSIEGMRLFEIKGGEWKLIP